MRVPNTHAPTVKADRGNHFLLIVDSDVDNLLYTSSLLKRFEYQTFKAGTAKLALEIATVAVPSLVITTLSLADMSGLDLIQLIRKHPNTSSVPLIAMNKPGESALEQQCRNVGVACCIDQPVAPELLYQAVQMATEAKPRSCIRVRKLLPVKIDDMPIDSAVDMCTMDLSERGMFLRTNKPTAENLKLSLRIYLSGKVIPAEAEVIYSDKTGIGPYGEPGMGLQFVNIAPHDQDVIQKFIRTEITRGITPGNA